MALSASKEPLKRQESLMRVVRELKRVKRILRDYREKKTALKSS